MFGQANNVMSLMFDAILKNQVKAIMPAIKKNYFQIGVSAIENNKLADTSVANMGKFII